MAFNFQEAQAWNASLKIKRPSAVALFVGGTSGIGESTAKRFAITIERPTIYIVGRSNEAGTKIVEELKAANQNGTYNFLPADVSNFQNIDKICDQVQTREKCLDLLFLSSGGIAFSKQETPTGIDLNHLLRYYSRMRFVVNLLSLLKTAEAPRVVSILAGGKEVPIEEDNLDLTKNFSLGASAGYPSTMTSLAFEHLAIQNPSISFIHEFPGVVVTPLFQKTFGTIMGTIVGFLMKPFSITVEQSGEWNVFLSTSPSFPCKDAVPADTAEEPKLKIATASTGVVGDGSYILNYNGQDTTNEKLMADLREKGMREIVWKHTLETFDRILSSA